MDRETEGNGDAFVLPITISICLLLFYYFQYTVAVLIGFKRLIFDFKKKTGRKVTFISGVCVHLFFIFCVLFGVFSRHFANGGVQLVAYTVINLYVYVLCIFNWPVVLYCTEFDITDTADDQGKDQEGVAGGELALGISPVKRFTMGAEEDEDGEIELR